ncbi:MAG: methyltransferase domain-containing protein [Treponema sp.]|nr:methyltransferase domain-containing protein [Treponema sp.]
MTALERYYGKFDESHRLQTRHGQVEFRVSMKYIHDFIPQGQKVKILDLGAGTGAYSVPLAREGHSVTAVELVARNLAALEARHENVNCWPGDARDLHFLADSSFDITLLFGPLYHLHGDANRLQALAEARRVTRPGGHIFAAYVMNEYSVVCYGFRQHHALQLLEEGRLDGDFHTVDGEEDLYGYVRLEDIDRLAQRSGLERVKTIAPDGPADYIRKELNEMDTEEFEAFIRFQLATCERRELLGASSHIVDILRKP